MNCSFCGWSEHSVELLVTARQGSAIAICDQCIGLCSEILRDERAKKHYALVDERARRHRVKAGPSIDADRGLS